MTLTITPFKYKASDCMQCMECDETIKGAALDITIGNGNGFVVCAKCLDMPQEHIMWTKPITIGESK